MNVGWVFREKLLFSTPAWFNSVLDESGDPFMHCALGVPELLQVSDSVAGGQAARNTISTLLDVLYDLEQELEDTRTSWYSTMETTSLPCQMESINAFPLFRDLCGNMSPVFAKAIVYDSFAIASAHLTYGTCLLLIRQCRLQVYLTYPYSSPGTTAVSLLRQRTSANASNICQSMAYLSQPCMRFLGAATAGSHLYFAMNYYEWARAHTQLAWCRRMQSKLSERSGIATCA